MTTELFASHYSRLGSPFSSFSLLNHIYIGSLSFQFTKRPKVRLESWAMQYDTLSSLSWKFDFSGFGHRSISILFTDFLSSIHSFHSKAPDLSTACQAPTLFTILTLDVRVRPLGNWAAATCCGAPGPGHDWLIVKVFPNPRTRPKSVHAVQAMLGSHIYSIIPGIPHTPLTPWPWSRCIKLLIIKKSF